MSTSSTTQMVDVGITKVMDSHLISGSGPYNNPLELYNPGHQHYTDYIYGQKTQPDISGIIKNIDTLAEGNVMKILQPEDAIRVFDPDLIKDIIIEPEYSGLSVNLKFGNFNVITTDNTFKNF